MKELFATLVCAVLCIAAVQAQNKEDMLSMKERQIAAISIYTARGYIPELKQELASGLDAGLTVNEIKEILIQLYAYSGFPRSTNALGTFLTVLKEREEKGIEDIKGKKPTPVPVEKVLRSVQSISGNF